MLGGPDLTTIRCRQRPQRRAPARSRSSKSRCTAAVAGCPARCSALQSLLRLTTSRGALKGCRRPPASYQPRVAGHRPGPVERNVGWERMGCAAGRKGRKMPRCVMSTKNPEWVDGTTVNTNCVPKAIPTARPLSAPGTDSSMHAGECGGFTPDCTVRRHMHSRAHTRTHIHNRPHTTTTRRGTHGSATLLCSNPATWQS